MPLPIETTTEAPAKETKVLLCVLCGKRASKLARNSSGHEKNLCKSCHENHVLTCYECENEYLENCCRFVELGDHHEQSLCVPCVTVMLSNEEIASCCDCGTYAFQLIENRCTICLRNHRANSLFHDPDITSDKFISGEKGEILKTDRIFSVEIEAGFRDDDAAENAARSVATETGIARDGSIDSESGIEFQTPLLKGRAGETYLMDTLKTIKDNNGYVNVSCGLHIHIDGRDIHNQNLRKRGVIYAALLAFYVSFEDVITSFLPYSRRSGRYCRPVKEIFHLEEIMGCGTSDSVEALWYRTTDREVIDNIKLDTKHRSRYCGVNMHALFAMKHLEIRYHSGTLNLRKILEWAELHNSIVQYCHNPSYEAFREASRLPDLAQRTDLMFDLLNTPQSTREYYRSRQKAFISKLKKEIQCAE